MLALVLAMMTALHPSAPRTGSAHAFARAIADVATLDAPPAGMDRALGAALLVVYGWKESRFALPAKRGDGGRARCAFQVHASGAYGDTLERDPVACVRAAYAIMRASQRLCGDLRGFCGNCYAKDAEPAALVARDRARTAQGILDAARMTLASD